MPTPEENMANALKRADKYRSEGNLERAATWEASAERYRGIIDAKARIATAQANLEKIKERIVEAKNQTPQLKVLGYSETTSRPNADCPSGHERVIIHYDANRTQTGVTSLGCMGGVRGEPRENNEVAPSGSVSPIPLTPSSISSIPSNISPVTQTPPPPPVKTAPIDTILFNDDAVPIQIMADLIFENIGGQELINIARNDTVNGQTVIYQPIKNLTSIQQEYNPNNVVALQATSDKYFQNFSIKLDDKVPTDPTGPNGAHVYIDPATGALIVEAVNLQVDEQIEVEITTSGTIYEAEL